MFQQQPPKLTKKKLKRSRTLYNPHEIYDYDEKFDASHNDNTPLHGTHNATYGTHNATHGTHNTTHGTHSAQGPPKKKQHMCSDQCVHEIETLRRELFQMKRERSIMRKQNFRMEKELCEEKSKGGGILGRTFGAVTSFLGSVIGEAVSYHRRFGIPNAKSVEKFVNTSQKSCEHEYPLRIRSLMKVENFSDESADFVLSARKENNMLLFHEIPNAHGLDEGNNFFERATKKLGTGIYFSSDPWYMVNFQKSRKHLVLSLVNLDGAKALKHHLDTSGALNQKSFYVDDVDLRKQRFDEFCVETSFNAVPLWVVTLE